MKYKYEYEKKKLYDYRNKNDLDHVTIYSLFGSDFKREIIKWDIYLVTSNFFFLILYSIG